MACLGSGLYSAQIRVVGTGALVEVIDRDDVLNGTWNRLISATSTVTMTLGVTGTYFEKCCRYLELAKGIPAYELYLWREVEGLSPQLVWKGTLTSLTLQAGNTITLVAKDSSWWLSKRRMPTISYLSQDVNLIAQQIANYGYSLNNPAGVVVRAAANSPVVTGEKIFAVEDASRALDNVTDVIRGISYWTCVLQDFRIGLTTHVRATITDDDTTEVPPLNWDADNYATKVFARTSSTAYAVAGGIDTTRFGIPILVEAVIDANAGNNTDAATFATTRLNEMNSPGPTMEASNSSLSPSFDVDINELIPGSLIRTNFSGYCEPDPRELYISSVEGSWNSGDEDIRLSLNINVGEGADSRVSSV